MSYNFRTKACIFNDASYNIGRIINYLAAVKLSVERRIIYFNYSGFKALKTLCSRDLQIIGN